MYILTKGKENRFLAILFFFLDYMDVFMFVNVLELYKIIHYLIQWLYAGRRETNVIYHYSNIDPCETIKVHDYMYAWNIKKNNLGRDIPLPYILI